MEAKSIAKSIAELFLGAGDSDDPTDEECEIKQQGAHFWKEKATTGAKHFNISDEIAPREAEPGTKGAWRIKLMMQKTSKNKYYILIVYELYYSILSSCIEWCQKFFSRLDLEAMYAFPNGPQAMEKHMEAKEA